MGIYITKMIRYVDDTRNMLVFYIATSSLVASL